MGITFSQDLYYGRIAPWESPCTERRSKGYRDLSRRMNRERIALFQSFTKGQKVEFCRYEKLFEQIMEEEKLASFEEGLRIGAQFMQSVLEDKG